MTMHSYATKQTGTGAEEFSVTLPAEISVKVDANKQVSFIIHAEQSGNVKLPPLGASLLDHNGETLFATSDSRTLGSNNQHFITVGKPKTTSSTTDKEVDPQVVKYYLVALGPDAAGAGRQVRVDVRHA